MLTLAYAVRSTTSTTEAQTVSAVQNDTTSAVSNTTSFDRTTEHVLAPTRWEITHSDFSKNHIYKIVYFNLNLDLNLVCLLYTSDAADE